MSTSRSFKTQIREIGKISVLHTGAKQSKRVSDVCVYVVAFPKTFALFSLEKRWNEPKRLEIMSNSSNLQMTDEIKECQEAASC